ncbi:hypothetical protein O0J73_07205 [Stenotrophomonas sp. Sm6012]|uniref:hypothetical protein n=1 Tax=Stenotrophomonas sp. Sm6012 TaxID=3002745 RepID=UPI0027E3FADC|nr:hypothetical protein [Stenotrophomonas sp. Sm6012]MDQ7280519.1 hypothetical protein [Stenotrophomonas sp. Sm6012]
MWLKGDEAERFQGAADERALSIAAFLKRAADATMDAPDPRDVLRAFATELRADLRADLRGEAAKVAEAVALIAERQEEIRGLFHRFLNDLNEQQINAVKVAVEVGRQHGQAEAMQAMGAKPSYRSSPPPPLG